MNGYPTQEFDTLALAEAALVGEDRKRYVLVKANETAAGAVTHHFFDGVTLQPLGGGVTAGEEFLLIPVSSALNPDDIGNILNLATGITLTVDPTLITSKTLKVRGLGEGAMVAVSSGAIKTRTLEDLNAIGVGERQTIYLKSDGVNLIEL